MSRSAEDRLRPVIDAALEEAERTSGDLRGLPEHATLEDRARHLALMGQALAVAGAGVTLEGKLEAQGGQEPIQPDPRWG